MCSLLVSFFFACSSSPPALRSFPTRRSSDLASPPALYRSDHRRAGRSDDDGREADRGADCTAGTAGAGHRDPPVRSEEHTSELQSRGHLVCRLLLEKKNRVKALKQVMKISKI